MTQAKKNHAIDSSLNLEVDESISLWLDGEAAIDPDLLNSPYGRQLWDNYHLIGDVLRSEELAIEPSDLFYARISKAIDEEPTVFAPKNLQPPIWRRFLLPAAALSAALMLTLWFMQPQPIETAPVIASADELWMDYIDAHRSLAGTGPAAYVSYVAGN